VCSGHCGITRSSYGPPLLPNMTIATSPPPARYTNWILFTPLEWPCQGSLGFHWSPMKISLALPSDT
jgi:hypothetical protein